MTEPAMLVLGDEPASLDELRATLDRRYGLVLSRLRRLDYYCGSGSPCPCWQRMIGPSRSFAVWRRCSTRVVLSSSP
jgi:hypothetical protein